MSKLPKNEPQSTDAPQIDPQSNQTDSPASSDAACSLSSILSEVAELLDPMLHKKGVGRAVFSPEHKVLRLKFGHCQLGVAVGQDGSEPPYLFTFQHADGLLTREEPPVHCDEFGRTHVDGDPLPPVDG